MTAPERDEAIDADRPTPRIGLQRRRHVAATTVASLVVGIVGLSLGASGVAATPGDPAEGLATRAASTDDPGASAEDRSALGLDVLVDPEFQSPADPTPRVLVRYATGTSPSAQRNALSSVGGTLAGEVGDTGFVAIETPSHEPQAVVETLADNPVVAEVQVDHVRTVAAAVDWSDDPYVDAAMPYLELARLPSAWEVADGSGVTVAVLDNGVSATHEDLRDKLVDGVDLVDRGSDATDAEWHGTIVAGVLAAAANGVGSVGAAPGASIMPVRVLDSSGTGSDSTIAEGLDWASSHGADVINLSLSGIEPSPVLRAALESAVARGVVVVIAAGNTGDEVLQYPAAYAAEIPGVLSVSATEDDGRLLEQRGDDRTASSWNDAVSIAAPGREIIGPSYGLNAAYVIGTGTSLAAPWVSGAAALLVQRHPGWTPEQVARRLTSTARDAGPRGVDPFYGAGVLDAGAALGRTPAIPLDRVGDDGPSDDLPEGARRVALGEQHTVALWSEGDVDWVRVDGTEQGVGYTVRSVDGAAPISLEVFDRDGRRYERSTGRFESVGGPLFVRYAAPGGVWQTSQFGDRQLTRTFVVERAQIQRQPDKVRFGAPQPTTGPLGMGSPLLADVTGDGVDDIVGVASRPTATGVEGLAVLAPGRADGTFGPSTRIVVPGAFLRPRLRLADLDGDGVAEVVAIGETKASVISARGGTWGPPTVLLGGRSVSDVAAADLDQDGDVDMAATSSDGVLVLLRRDGGTYTAETITTPEAVGGPTAVDLDGVHGLDLLLNGGRTMLARADGSFVPGPVIAALEDVAGRRQLVDMNGDGVEDVLSLRETSVVVYSPPNGLLSVPGDQLRVEVSSVVADGTGDVNGDGRLDLVGAGRLTIQAVDGTFGESQYVHGISYFPWTVPRELTGDGRTDLLSCDMVACQIYPQIDLEDPPGPAMWVWGVTPADDSDGVTTTSTVTVTAARTLDASSVTPTSVRLVDRWGADVPAALSTDASGRTVTLRPRTDLLPGEHYELLVTGLRDTAGSTMEEVVRSWFTVGADGDRYTPLTPKRVLDTRTEYGSEPVRPGTARRVRLSEWLPRGATAAVLNVTAAQPEGPGFVRVYPADTDAPPPATSNLNLTAGVDQPNLVTVQLGPFRDVMVATGGSATQVVVDLAGYYSPGGATAYEPVDPVRVMDMRTGLGGVPARPLAAGKWVDLDVTGRAGVPEGASAVVLNVTGVAPGSGTNVRVYPTPAPYQGDEPPLVSNLNLAPGRDQPNLVTVRVGEGGRVRFYVQSADVALVADLAGYYSPTGTAGFHPTPPARIADTRSGLGLPGGRVLGGVTRSLPVAGTHDIPVDAVAAALNVTAAQPTTVSNVRVFPSHEGDVPLVSNLNVVAGRDEPNMVLARLGDGGAVSLFSQSGQLDLVVDAYGWFRIYG